MDNINLSNVQPKMPSVVQMAANLGTTFYYAASSMVAGNHQVLATEEETKRRLDICMQCDHYVLEQSRCMKCGCYMTAKTKVQAAKCPVNKW